ncbi:MAG TPA: ribosome maturation factor RimM [Rhodanobacteraceae bacterium]|nr:ribosome maturation factor RimM [Rhodanobacteraceae bacterium]
MSAAETPTRWVPVGRIVGLHGVRGALRLESWTQPRRRIFDYRPWRLGTANGATAEFDGATGQTHGKGLLALLPGVEDRDQAQAWLGAEVAVPRSVLPPAGEGEYYWADLEGLEVVTLEGTGLGRVSHLVATGANDVMVVRDGHGRERLLPFVLDHTVREVDLQAGRIVVDWDPEF